MKWIKHIFICWTETKYTDTCIALLKCDVCKRKFGIISMGKITYFERPVFK